MTDKTDQKTQRVLQDIAQYHPTSAREAGTSAGAAHKDIPAIEEAESAFSASSASDSSGSSSSSVELTFPTADGVKDASGSGSSGTIERLSSYPFPKPRDIPTQEGPYGVRYDFNLGIRVLMPEGEGWRLRLWDQDTDTCLFDCKGGGQFVSSRKKYFLNGLIELYRDDELVWSHVYNAEGKKVAITMPAGTLGDPLGWSPYAERFAHVHKCDVTVLASRVIVDLLAPQYPEIRFVTEDEFMALREEFYATYYIGLFFSDEGQEWQPRDFRNVGLHRTAGWILGVDPTEVAPRVDIAQPDTRPMEEPYVVVAVQASSACKLWNHPTGWLDLVIYLKKIGYRVVCIDKEPVTGKDFHLNALPHGVEDETGDRPLAERARWIKHAEFFVGLSSGLSWLAWGVGTPVVMISGFTDPHNEFYTPYRVFSTHGCNSCWHDIRTPFQHDDYLFCPRHGGTDKIFECTRTLGISYVVSVIKRLCRDHGYIPPVERDGRAVVLEDKAQQAERMAKEGYEVKHHFTLD